MNVRVRACARLSALCEHVCGCVRARVGSVGACGRVRARALTGHPLTPRAVRGLPPSLAAVDRRPLSSCASVPLAVPLPPAGRLGPEPGHDEGVEAARTAPHTWQRFRLCVFSFGDKLMGPEPE